MRLRLIIAAVIASLALTSVALAGSRTVKLTDNKFSPSSLTVKRGTKVVFRFAGKKPHNVAGPGFRSPVKKSGSYSRTFRKKGKFTIVCQLHKGMRMSLRVK